MNLQVLPLATVLSLISFHSAAVAQSYEACEDAVADSFSLAPGTDALAIPGVAADFEITAGGTLVRRGNGTARFSAVVRRKTSIDRIFFIELELAGEVLSGQGGNPPANALPLGLASTAYAPAGPVDPTQFTYYTSATGRLVGHGGYRGALLNVTLAAAAQIGDGASNRHVGRGMRADLAMQIVSQPVFSTLVPTGDAVLTLGLFASKTLCASHADRDDNLSQGALRYALDLPGVGSDYVFVPAGEWTEGAGTSVLSGTLRRELDFEDRWQVSITGSQRVDPGDASYPPAAGASLQLLSSAYATGGGVLDADMFRFYEVVSGQLVGEGLNAGAVIDLTGQRPMQVGLGADNANAWFGVYGEFTAAVSSQGSTRTFAISGPGSFRANVANTCILPYPNQTPGLVLTSDNVTGAPAMLTGTNLAWVNQLTFDGLTLTTNDREWMGGHLKVIDTTQIEVWPPQAYTPGTYQTRVFTRSGAGGFRNITLGVPASPVIRSDSVRFGGEPVDWVVSHGNLGQSLVYIAFSGSLAPSVVPQVSLDIGNGFSQILTAGPVFTDAVTGAGVLHIPALPVGLRAFQFYCQAVFLPFSTPGASTFPTSDVWLTRFR